MAGLPPRACYGSFGAALAEHGAEADGVVVITPSSLHGGFVRQALEAGKHVLVEKPFVHHLAEAEELVGLAESRGLCLVVAQNYRCAPRQGALQRLLATREYGPPGFATFLHHRYRPDPRAFTMPHSMLLEMSVHHFDDFRFVFGGEPAAISARSFNPPWSRYPGAAAVQALIEWPLPDNREFAIAYTGTLASTSDRMECRVECERGALIWEGPALSLIPTGTREKQRLETPDDGRTSEQRVADLWRDYILEGHEPSISGRQNLGTLRLIDAAIRSSETGQRVVL
jgi:predicted dehydrogenase